MYIKKYNSPAGVIYMRSDGKYLTGLWFEGSRDLAKHTIDCEENTLMTKNALCIEVIK